MAQSVAPPKFNVGKVPSAASPSCWVATQLKGGKAESKKLDQKELRKTESVHIQAVLKRELEKAKLSPKTNIIASKSSPKRARSDVQLNDDIEPVVTQVDSRKGNRWSQSRQKSVSKKTRPHTDTTLAYLEKLPSREKSRESIKFKTLDEVTSGTEDKPKKERSKVTAVISYILIGLETAMATLILVVVLVAEGGVNVTAFLEKRYYKSPLRYVTYVEMVLLLISAIIGVIGICGQSKAIVYISMVGHLIAGLVDIGASTYACLNQPGGDSQIPDIFKFIYLGTSFVLVGLIILVTILSVRGVGRKRTTIASMTVFIHV